MALRTVAFLLAALHAVNCTEEPPAKEPEADATSEAALEAEVPTEYTPPTAPEGVIFVETFADDIAGRWTPSKDEIYEGEWKVEEFLDPQGLPKDQGLMVGKAAARHAISHLLPDFDAAGKTFVFQYELQFKEGLECGGAYFKLLTKDDSFAPEAFVENTPYIVMFGPDKCGTTNKIHFILRYKNPISEQWNEHHLKAPPQILGSTGVIDKKTHLYTLIIRQDSTFEILVDMKSAKKGNLKDDLDPPINPPKQIDDPEDKKPEDWVDNKKMEDPESKKPDDWDEDAPREIDDESAEKPSDWDEDAADMVPDPDATKPDDWDEDEDGDWEAPIINNPECKKHGCGPWKAPMIPNPEYKGKWSVAMIDNPDYKGEWSPAQIDNPHFFEDENPYNNFAPIGALGLELWTMQKGILFDNVLVTFDEAAATSYATATWKARADAEDAAQKKEEADQKAKRRETQYDDSFMGKIKYGADIAMEFVEANAIAVACTMTILFIPIIIKMFMGRKEERQEEQEEQEPEQEPEQEQESEKEEEKPKPKPKPKVAKEEPKAAKEEPVKKRSTRSKKAD